MSKTERLPIFKERLNDLLLSRNEPVTEFAKTVGVSRQTAGFYLNGDRIPDAETLSRICESCGVSSDWLIGLSDDRTRTPSAVDTLGLSQGLVNELSNPERPFEFASLSDVINGTWRALNAVLPYINAAIQSADKSVTTTNIGETADIRDFLISELSALGFDIAERNIVIRSNAALASDLVADHLKQWTLSKCFNIANDTTQAKEWEPPSLTLEELTRRTEEAITDVRELKEKRGCDEYA